MKSPYCGESTGSCLYLLVAPPSPSPFPFTGIDKLGGPFDGKIEAYDPEILGRLTSSVSSALDQAEAALYGIKENTVLPGQHGDG